MAINNANNETEQQAAMEQQRRQYMQMMQQQQKMQTVYQIANALQNVSVYSVLKMASQYGLSNSIVSDPMSNQCLSQKLYQVLVANNNSTDVEDWKLLATSLMQAYQSTVSRNLFGGQQMMGGMNQMGMGMNPMMGGMSPMGMGMYMNPMMGGMGMGMQMPGMGMQSNTEAKEGETEEEANSRKVSEFKNYIANGIMQADPILYICVLINNGLEFTEDKTLEQMISTILVNACYRMSDMAFNTFFGVVSSLYQREIMSKAGNGQANFNQQNNAQFGMNPMMGGMQMGMSMGMPSMMGGMNQMGMGMNPMMGGMNQMGMSMNPMMGGMAMGMQMPGMNQNGCSTGVKSIY